MKNEREWKGKGNGKERKLDKKENGKGKRKINGRKGGRRQGE